MKTSVKAGSLLIAGIFALSGCGSSEGAQGSEPAESGSASPTPTLAVGQEQYSADELESALAAVNEAEGLNGEIQNDAELRPQFEDASYLETGVDPEQCTAVLSSTFDRKIQDGNLAFMGFNATDMLAVISYDDKSVLEKQFGDSENTLADCGEFQMTNGDARITAVAESATASTEAPVTQAYRTTVRRESGDGVVVHVVGISGTTQVSATLIDPTDEAASVAQSEEVINAVLAELEKD